MRMRRADEFGVSVWVVRFSVERKTPVWIECKVGEEGTKIEDGRYVEGRYRVEVKEGDLSAVSGEERQDIWQVVTVGDKIEGE